MSEATQQSCETDMDQHSTAFFQACFATSRIPNPTYGYQELPNIREWHPGLVSSDAVPAEILKRHPLFSFGFKDLPEMRIKQAMRGATRSRFGKFSSQKMKRNIRARSDLEFDCIRWMEFDSSVEAYLEQPVMLRYLMGEYWRWHIPDLFCRRADGDKFIEVKFEEAAARSENEAKYTAIGVAVAALGYSYQLLTERQIRRKPAFDTLVELFLRNRWTPLPDDTDCRAIEKFLGKEEATICTISTQIPQVSECQVCALILRGFLSIDLDKPLGPQSLIRISGRQPIRAKEPYE